MLPQPEQPSCAKPPIWEGAAVRISIVILLLHTHTSSLQFSSEGRGGLVELRLAESAETWQARLLR